MALHGSESLLSWPFFAAFKELMTLNLAQRLFKVIHFGGNRKPCTTISRPLIVVFAIPSIVSEILPALYARANCVSKYVS